MASSEGRSEEREARGLETLSYEVTSMQTVFKR
jgi:hypothetical protein